MPPKLARQMTHTPPRNTRNHRKNNNGSVAKSARQMTHNTRKRNRNNSGFIGRASPKSPDRASAKPPDRASAKPADSSSAKPADSSSAKPIASASSLRASPKRTRINLHPNLTEENLENLHTVNLNAPEWRILVGNNKSKEFIPAALRYLGPKAPPPPKKFGTLPASPTNKSK